jgi:2-polyprenyl-3-methyl-5-hydroxy-6-metoxy-1,4-benzoquinol methylase
MTDALVREYYSTQVRTEWRRLVQDAYHRLEFETTLYFLDKYLPQHGLVLDAGGGPGRYTCELARRGYQVVLMDATQANLDFARRQVKRAKLQAQVREFTAGSIADLSRYMDASFDAVLCTGGPLSHILDPQMRQMAVSELVRVARPGAPLFVSVMGKLGVLVVILMISQHEIKEPHFKLIRDTGDYLGGYGFTACHFYLPEELRKAFNREDLDILELAGLEGISSHHSKELNKLAGDEDSYRIWLEMHFQTCTHPVIVGISEHMLIVCCKKAR